MRVLLLTPFILGNSAGALGALLPLIVGAIIGLGVIIAICWGLFKWLT
jgi:hypothetical protein